MPQLDPSPWLILLISSWLAMLISVVPKTLSHTTTPNPSLTETHLPNSMPWAWPWT